MSSKKGGGRRPLSLLIWGILAIVPVAAAYLGGSALAQQWFLPSLSSPPDAIAAPAQATAAAVARIEPGIPVESTLGAEAEEEWQFQGNGGQSAALEVWLHPGSGSSVDAELSIRLIAPDGTVVADESGSAFLLPYVFAPSLPETGLYRVQVAPTSGAPGRYSLALTLSDGEMPVAAGGPGTPHPTGRASSESAVMVTEGMFIWPSARREISGWTFHDPGNPGHIGLDIAARMWDPIVAIADGTVVFAEWGGGYGNLVIVDHGDGWDSYYAHLSEFAVEAGEEVRQGQLLGGAGTTGYSTGPHLHFEIRYYGRPVDPHVHLP